MQNVAFNQPSQYLFGYGSLINLQSRVRTLPDCSRNAIPVTVAGFERSWSYKCSKTEYTAVCVERKALSSFVNGVLIEIHDTDLKLLDEREFDYARGRVSLSAISFAGHSLDIENEGAIESFNAIRQDKLITISQGRNCVGLPLQLPPDAIVWVYENHSQEIENFSSTSSNISASRPIRSHTPCRHYPIPQSYVDVILGGCLSVSYEFARDFLFSTKGWTSILNDREHQAPKCVRDGSFCEDMIDSLLFEIQILPISKKAIRIF